MPISIVLGVVSCQVDTWQKSSKFRKKDALYQFQFI